MNYRKVFGWLTLDMIVFVIINVFFIYYFRDRFLVLNNVNFLTLIVLGLAAFRAAHIISNEVITKPLRAAFVEEHKEGGKIIEEPKKYGFLGAMGMLMYCPSCSGVWISAALVYVYIFWPAQTFVVALFLALSGIERFCSGILGWFKK